MAESPPFLCYIVYHDWRLYVTAYQVPAGSLALAPGTWLVAFQCRPVGFDSFKTAHWLPSGRWDDSRWHPVGARLVPPTALAAVEAWLAERAAVGVAS